MTRDEAIRKLQKQKAEYLEEWVDYSGVAEAYDMAIEALHREEAEEKGYCHRIRPRNVEVVVRCKDCRYRELEGEITHFYWCRINERSVDDDGFCTWGERKGGDSE
jgi:hypothetical protein